MNRWDRRRIIITFFPAICLLHCLLPHNRCLGFVIFRPCFQVRQSHPSTAQLFSGWSEIDSSPNTTSRAISPSSSPHQSRRKWLQTALTTATVACMATSSQGAPLTEAELKSAKTQQQQQQPNSGAKNNPPLQKSLEKITKKTTPKEEIVIEKSLTSNITEILSESNINVTEVRTDKVLKTKTLLTIDKEYEIVQVQDVPSWVPKSLVRPPRIIKVIPNSELLISGIIAGSFTEIIRVSLLYPLLTITNRIQTVRRGQPRIDFESSSIGDKMNDVFMSFWRQARRGDLYAGIVPTLLVTVPASGVYFGIRDVYKRLLQSAIKTSTPIDDIAVALGAAFVADVVSLTIRTPADVLATRLQVQGSESNAGDWFRESLERLPAILVTDLPFILSKIALKWAVTNGGGGLGQYEVETIVITCVCAALTTPFDVARTRIVMERTAYSKPGANYTELAPVDGVVKTMKKVMKEGDVGVLNLFAGCIERTIYLGIGRAWLDPIRVIGYLGIRDAVLLEWFE